MLPSTYFSRYEKLLNQLYIEPKSKEIVGTFLTIANEKGKQADANPRQQKKTTGEETSEIKGHSGYVAKPKMRKGWRQENQLLPCLNFFLCLPRVEKLQNFGFSKFFHG